MLVQKLLRLMSLLLASAATFVAPGAYLPTAMTQASAQEISCFIGVDYAAMSLDELTAVIAQAVAQLTGLSDAEIAAAIAAQIGDSASGCTPAQLSALVRNVAIILQDLGVNPSGLEQILVAGILDSQEDTTVVVGVVPSLATVY